MHRVKTNRAKTEQQQQQNFTVWLDMLTPILNN